MNFKHQESNSNFLAQSGVLGDMYHIKTESISTYICNCCAEYKGETALIFVLNIDAVGYVVMLKGEAIGVRLINNMLVGVVIIILL